MTARLVAVAGCLFEVHLDDGPGRWEWVDDTDGEVSLVSSAGGRRFRFRAEREADATLHFTLDALTMSLPVRIAPEAA